MTTDDNFSFGKYAWKQFKQKRTAYVSFYIIISLFVVAILSPFIANHQPLFVKYQEVSYFPAFSTLFNSAKIDTIHIDDGGFEVINFNDIDWRTKNKDFVIWAPVPYSPNFTDKYNRDYASPTDPQRYKNHEGKIEKIPFRLRHFMGTDKLGRDVAAGIVHGSKVSLLVGIFSMLIAALIGIPLGAFAGYFGNHEIKVPRLQFWMSAFGLFIGFFVAFVSRSQIISSAFQEGMLLGTWRFTLSLLIVIVSFLGFSFIGKKVALGKFLKKEVDVPIDAFVSRTIEILNSLPSLILIITIAAIINERSLVVLVLIIGLTSWTGIARFMRAEMLKIKELEYIQTAKVLGFSNRRIIFKHALPNGLAPVFTSIAFGIASAILIESGLSFLGIGVPDDIITWGNLLSLGREEFEASWLVIFPGLAIFVTVTAYNLIGEGLRDALDPKLKK
ncbi:MAG: peptide/nickel transport system permease protein [Saprospiraceae bacterium]|jgi:peptide/nickel transport system permease protein